MISIDRKIKIVLMCLMFSSSFSTFASFNFKHSIPLYSRIDGSAILNIGNYDREKGFSANQKYTWTLNILNVTNEEEYINQLKIAIQSKGGIVSDMNKLDSSYSLSITFSANSTYEDLSKALQGLNIRVMKGERKTSSGVKPVISTK